MKELLEAGVHFGHQTKRWNPKMKEYILANVTGSNIIDLQKTLKLFKDAMRYVANSRYGQDGSLCRYKTPGAGSHSRGGQPLRPCTT